MEELEKWNDNSPYFVSVGIEHVEVTPNVELYEPMDFQDDANYQRADTSYDEDFDVDTIKTEPIDYTEEEWSYDFPITAENSSSMHVPQEIMVKL